MAESTWNLLLQIPLAGVVVVVVILFLRFVAATNGQFMGAMREQIALFMTAIKEQREANNRALGELTLTIKDMQNSINVRMGGIEQAMRDHVAEGDTRPRRNKTGYNQP
jgi:hypothetical protein